MKKAKRVPLSYDTEMTPEERYKAIIRDVWEKINRQPEAPPNKQFLRGFTRGKLE